MRLRSLQVWTASCSTGITLSTMELNPLTNTRCGLVTLEDLLEEIVGDMGDEYEPIDLPEIMTLADGSYDIDGEMPLDDVSDLLQLPFDEEDEDDTLGGYIFSRLGRKPEEGDEVTQKDWTFTVLKMDRLRIERVKAEKAEAE